MPGTGAVVQQVLMMFLIVVVGAVLRRMKRFGDGMIAGLSDLLLSVSMPCLVISAFQFAFTERIALNMLAVFAVAAAAHLLGFLAGRLGCRRGMEPRRRAVLRFSLTFSNCAFMAFPLVEAMFGAEGLIYASVYLASYNLFQWTLGVRIYRAEERLSWRHLLTPGLISVAIGAGLFFLGWRLPGPLAGACSQLGALTTPVSMLLIGARMSDSRPRDFLGDPAIYLVALVRLVAMPLLLYAALRLTGLDPLPMGVAVMSIGMPPAAATVMFAERYGGDAALASRVVFVVTLLSMVTIPVVMGALF